MADINIADVRAKYPQYKDMNDQQLADGLHKKFYSDMPADTFYQKIGLKPAATPEAPSMLDQIGHQAGLAARYGAEILGTPVTEAADLMAKGIRATEPDFSMVPGIKKRAPSPTVTETFESGLDAMGLPKPANAAEKTVGTVTKAAPYLYYGGQALLKPAAEIATSIANKVGKFRTSLKGEESAKAGETARQDVMKLSEEKITSKAAEKGSLDNSFQTLTSPAKPIVGRDVSDDMVKNVENRTKDFDEAYTTWRNGLKDEWQQAARKRTASGDLFQNQPSTKKFAQKIDAMSAKYANDPAVVRQLDSLKKMVMGDQGKLPSFDAIETAQQKIVAQAKDPSTAAVPNMVLDYHAVADSLNNAMAEYAPQYGQMIKAWPKVMEQKEALQKITTFTNKYAVELEKISPTSQANPRETLNASRSIIVKLKNDGFIDDATKSQYIKRIEDAETQYGQTDVAKKRASEATKAAMTLGASAIGAGAVGWWGYQIFGTHGKQ